MLNWTTADILKRNGLLRLFIIGAFVLSLMLTGCRASRSVTNGGQGGEVARPTVVLPEDMSRDMRDDQRKLVEEALTWLGTPYRYGGTNRSGTDCSGMTMQVYKKVLGISLPRSSREQQKFCKSIRKSALDAGDLIFFSTGRDKTRVSHVGMYIGEDKFIHASGSRGVIVSDINERYYMKNFHSAGHVARGEDKTAKKTPGRKSDAKITEAESATKTETTPVKLEITLDRFLELNQKSQTIDEAIEAKVDSIYASFIE